MMTTTTMTTAMAGHVAAEDLMALVDGELQGTELASVQQHVGACTECAGAVAALREEQAMLRGWSVGVVPAAVERGVVGRVQEWESGARVGRAAPAAGRVKWWAWGSGAGALTAGLCVMLVMVSGGRSRAPMPSPAAPATTVATEPAPQGGLEMDKQRELDDQATKSARASSSVSEDEKLAYPAPPARPMVAKPSVANKMMSSQQAMADRGMRPGMAPEVTAPMIARTVSLTLTVKDVERAREGLEGLLRAYGGYAGQMEVSTPVDGVRTLHASLRVPSGQLRGMLAELKGYGRVDNETQSGEEVGQQHADLVARLGTARESEVRLRGILRTRTGDVSEVLEVEQEIARVRGEIEEMEAEQQGLEHRVSYATVELQMDEEGHGAVGASVWSRLGEGARHGGENAVGALVWLLEYGLAVLLVVGLVGVPVWWAWRRWRRLSRGW